MVISGVRTSICSIDAAITYFAKLAYENIFSQSTGILHRWTSSPGPHHIVLVSIQYAQGLRQHRVRVFPSDDHTLLTHKGRDVRTIGNHCKPVSIMLLAGELCWPWSSTSA